MDDHQIIELFFKRAEEAIGAVTDKYGRLIRSVAYNILRDENDSEECVNDTYMALWDSIPPQRPDSLISYACKIARNVSIKRLRYRTAEKRNSFYDVALDELEDCFKGTQDIQSEAEEKDLTAAVNRFLTQAKETDRILFMKRYWFCMEVDEISKETGLSKNHINVRLHRTREKLKTYLMKENLYES